jgi:hypothetical protein
MCWWLNLAKLEKSYSPIWHSGWAGFGSFRTEQRKKENMKTLMLKECLRHGKGRRNIKEPGQEIAGFPGEAI